MPHVVYYAALALDGRISGPEDDLAFLATLEGAGGSYEEFFAGVDSLVMGGHTWRFVVRHGSWPYGDRPAWIVTRRPLEPLDGARVEAFAGDVGAPAAPR
jgi:dihydrofolate reductase